MKKVNKRENKPKTLYKIISGIIFALQIAVMLLFSEGVIIKQLYNSRNYFYAEASLVATVIFLLLVVFYIILLLDFYNKKVIRKDEKLCSVKAGIIRAVVVFVITVVCLTFSFTDISYIDADGYHNDEVYKSFDEINSVHISVEKDVLSLPKASSSYSYNIICTTNWNSEEMRLSSENFYSYEDMYKFLKCIDSNSVDVDKSDFDNLIKYEKESLRCISSADIEENVRFIRLIRDY